MKKITYKQLLAHLNNLGHALADYDCERFGDIPPEECQCFVIDDIPILTIWEDGVYDGYAWLTKDVCYEQTFAPFLEDDKCLSFALSACGILPQAITSARGGLAFSRIGEQYEDKEVVALSEKDADAILKACEQLDKGNEFEQDEAESFRYIVANKMYTTFGIYQDELLVGMVFYRTIDDKKLGVLSELAVLPRYREQGLGKRLVKRALAAAVGYNYIYTCANTNFKSIALATACGFTFCGVKNLRLK